MHWYIFSKPDGILPFTSINVWKLNFLKKNFLYMKLCLDWVTRINLQISKPLQPLFMSNLELQLVTLAIQSGSGLRGHTSPTDINYVGLWVHPLACTRVGSWMASLHREQKRAAFLFSFLSPFLSNMDFKLKKSPPTNNNT